MSLKGREMLNSVAKEIASEVIAKNRDPEYKASLNKGECTRRLSVIMELEYSSVSDMLDRKIQEYIKMPRLFS